MIRVLHIIPRLMQGGVERVLANLIEHSDPVKFEHHLLITQGDLSFKDVVKGLPVSVYSQPQMGLAEQLKLFRKMDVISTTHPRSSILSAPVSFAFHKPTVVGVHAIQTEKRPPLRQLKLDLIMTKLWPLMNYITKAKIVCCTAGAQMQAVSYGMNPRLMRIIENGVDTDALVHSPAKGQALRSDLHIAPDAKVIGLAARYSRMKDIPNFIEAGRRLKEQNSSQPFRFLLCGDLMNESNTELVEKLKQGGIWNDARLLGVHHDMQAFYSALDVLASSSACNEALSMVLLEASSNGCLVIATDTGDHKMLMGRTGGICVPVQDSKALARGIETLLALPEAEKDARRKQAREAIVRHHDVRRMAHEYDDFYEMAVGLPPHTRARTAGIGH